MSSKARQRAMPVVVAVVCGILSPTVRAAGPGWQSLGPAGVDVSCLAADPTRAGTVYLGTPGAGAFRSDDRGGTWSSINEGLAGQDVFTLVPDPNATGTLYAGTILGVFKSADFGAHWTAANAGLPATSPGLIVVGSLVVNPARAGELYCLLVKTGPALFKSTDAGGSWKSANAGISGSAYTLAISKSSPSILSAFVIGHLSNDVYRSTDDGASWKIQNTATFATKVATSIAADPDHANVLLAADFGAWRSTDSGVTWIAHNEGLPAGTYPGAFFFLGDGTGTVMTSSSSGIFVSAGGSAPWTPVPVQPTPGISAFARSVSGGDFYAGDSRHAYHSSNGGSSWEMIDGDFAFPLETNVATSPAKSGVVYSNFFGVEKRSTDFGRHWTEIASLPAGLGSLVPSISSADRIYGSVAGSSFATSTDGGATWHVEDNVFGSSSFVSGIVECRGTPSRLYATASPDSIYRSDDAGVHWAKTTGTPAASFLGSLAVSASDPATACVVAGDNSFNSTIQMTTDSGATWTRRDHGIGCGKNDFCNINSVAIDPTNSRVVYAGQSVDTDTSVLVWKSTDGGATWKTASQNITMPTAPGTALFTDLGDSVRWIDIDPADSSRILLGDAWGPWLSQDGGRTWTSLVGNFSEGTEGLAVDWKAAPGVAYVASFVGIYSDALPARGRQGAATGVSLAAPVRVGHR